MFDTYAQQRIDINVNMSIPFYLMGAYAYYVEDKPIFTDAFFDNLAKLILIEWDNIEHRHKSLVTKDDLSAGTYLGKYPSIIEGAVESLHNNRK